MIYHAAKLKDNVGRVYDCLVGWSETERRYHVRCVREQWSTYIDSERCAGTREEIEDIAAEAVHSKGVSEEIYAVAEQGAPVRPKGGA